MVCTHCLDELERALDEGSIPGRLRRLPAAILATAVVVALVWGGSVAMGKFIGPAGSLASMECAAQGLGMGPALQLGGSVPTAVHTATPVSTPPASAPPAPVVLALRSWEIGPAKLVLHLHGAGFVASGIVCVKAGLSGQGQDGQPRRDSVGPIGMQAGADGAFSGSLDFGNAPGGYPNGYTVAIEASAIAGAPRGGGSAGVGAVVKGTTLTINRSADKATAPVG